MKLQRLVFPFVDTSRDLSRYWWHRLTVVSFIIAVVVTLFGVWITLNSNQSSAIATCLEFQLRLTDSIDRALSNCSSYPFHPRDNFIAGLVTAIVVSYLAQVIYFKVVLYVVLGHRKA